jgi:hypothetical protein
MARGKYGNPLSADARPSLDGDFFTCVARKLPVSLEQHSRADACVRIALRGAAPEKHAGVPST